MLSYKTYINSQTCNQRDYSSSFLLRYYNILPNESVLFFLYSENCTEAFTRIEPEVFTQIESEVQNRYTEPYVRIPYYESLCWVPYGGSPSRGTLWCFAITRRLDSRPLYHGLLTPSEYRKSPSVTKCWYYRKSYPDPAMSSELRKQSILTSGIRKSKRLQF